MALKTDDSDIKSASLHVKSGGNGDYYPTITFKGSNGLNQVIDVRVSMSGGNATPQVRLAIHRLYQALEDDELNEYPTLTSPNYQTMEMIHRIRVEKRPNEDHKRFYPESAVSITKSGVIVAEDDIFWRKFGTDAIWYKEESKARDYIEAKAPFLPEGCSSSYTIETIDYTAPEH